MSISLKNILTPQPKSKIKAGNGMKKGTYKFFTSSKLQLKFIDDFQYDKEALIFGTGGNANIHYCNEPFGTSTDCIVMYTNKNVNLKFLYYYISGNMYLLQNGFKGSGLKHISKDYILNISINLPDRKTQDTIVNRFDLLIDIIDKLNKKITYFDQLVKAKFIEMFGSIENNLYSYPTAILKEVCNKITDGTHKTPNYQSQGITFISAKNIIDGKLDFNNVKFITNDEYQIIQNRCQTELNDVLMSKSGTLGTVALVDTDIPLGLFESLAVIKYKRNLLSGEFLYEQLRSNSIQYQLLNKVKGIAIKHLHLNVIGEIKIILPPIELQNKFANFVNQVNKSKSAVKKCLEKAELLKSALTQEYFN